ncbi:MAG TPA: hypothetical protein VGM63_21030 [Mucilaginibacter sp.]|jgi:hypothetical protein
MATLFTFNLSSNMNYFYLFLGAGIVIVLLIIFYDIQNRKKVNDILRANKNVPPLFMLRSAEIKVSAIKSVLNNSGYVDAEIEETKYEISLELDKLVTNYRNRELPLTAYYAKIGSLLISANKLKAAITENAVHVHA